MSDGSPPLKDAEMTAAESERWEQIPTLRKQGMNGDLNLGSSWVGGVAPVAGDNATWDSTVTSANSTVLGADLDWGAIRIEDPADSVTISGANTLTSGAVLFEIRGTVVSSDRAVFRVFAKRCHAFHDECPMKTETHGASSISFRYMNESDDSNETMTALKLPPLSR